MTYRIDPHVPVGREVSRITNNAISEALARLVVLSDGGDFESEIHEVRKRCKELRALARLVRPDLTKSYGRFNVHVRDTARELSELRDAHVVLSTIDQVDYDADRETARQLERIREHREDVASEALESLTNGARRLSRASSHLREAGRIASSWNIEDSNKGLALGISSTYARARKGFDRVRNTNDDVDMHQWRKSVKDLWYQTRLLEEMAPSVLIPFAATLDTLSELLGDDHDRSVLIERVSSDRKRYGGKSAIRPAMRLVRDQQMTIRRSALRLGATVLAEESDAFGSRLATYLRLTRELGSESTLAR